MQREKACKFYKVAKCMANEFSKDPSTKVGCLMIEPNSYQILSTGYNGMPRGFDDIKRERWERPEKYKYIIHAEQNACLNACRYGICLEKSVCVVTLFPCSECAKFLVQAGISTIVTSIPDIDSCERWGESFALSSKILEEGKINLILLSQEELNNDH